MTDQDPFGPPPAPTTPPVPPPMPQLASPTPPPSTSTPTNQPESLLKLASGQRILNLAVLMYIVATILYGVSKVNPPEIVIVVVSGIVFVLTLLMLVSAVTGTIKIVNALAKSPTGGVLGSIIMILLLLIPIIGLLAMFLMNSRASARLKAAGYEIGLLGAKT